MTILDPRGTGAVPPVEDFMARPRSADAATIVAIFVVLRFMLPSKVVINGLPLSISAASLVGLGLGALWLCTQLTTTLGAAKGRSPVRTALFAYAFVLLASYCNSSFGFLPVDERLLGDHSMVTVFGLIFVGLVVCDGVGTRDRLYFLVRVVVACGAFVALIGILQFLIGFDLTLHLVPPGMHTEVNDSAVLARGGLRRVAGTTSHPIEFGVLCAMVAPLAVHLAFLGVQDKRWSAFWWGCVGLIGAGLMFSVSRSAILALAGAGIVLFLGWSGQRRVRMLVAGVGFLVVMKLVSPGLLGAFLSLFVNAGNDDSVMWRTHDYAVARELISLHPWLGRGIGTWYAPKHEVFDNQYLLTLVDSGIIGLVTAIGVLVAALYASLHVWLICSRFPEKLRQASSDRDLALSLTASLVIPVLTWATFDFAAFPIVSSFAIVLVGMSGALLRIVARELAAARAVSPA